MRLATHKRWLRVTAIVIGSFGPVFSLGAMDATREPARLTLDILSWPIDGATTFAHPDTRFLSALTGGFLTGWGVMVWLLAGRAFDAAPEAVRRAVLSGLCAWFLFDSAGSIASGNASNALFNVLVLNRIPLSLQHFLLDMGPTEDQGFAITEAWSDRTWPEQKMVKRCALSAERPRHSGICASSWRAL